MKLQGVGATRAQNDQYLDHDWHLKLTPRQLEAYIRYLFIALKENAYDFDSPLQIRPRSKWDGGTDNFGVKHKRVWNRVAAVIRQVDAVPGTWVAAHFAPTFHAVRAADNKGLIDNRPELLCSGISSEAYENYSEKFSCLTTERCAAAEISVATQIQLLQKVITNPDDLILYIIADKTNVNATPFFRHAFAAEYGCDRGVAKYIAQAAVDYDINQQLYDKLTVQPENSWWVSDELKTTVAQNRKYWSSYHG